MPPSSAVLGNQPENAVYTQHHNVIGTFSLLFAIAEEHPGTPVGQARHDGRYGTPNTG
jgi:UDP-sulfoquinovose synthase